jgi:uncharacterized protein
VALQMDKRLRGVRGRWLAAGGTAASVATCAWVAWWRPRRVVLRRRALGLPRWPAAFDGLRVAVIADLHTGAPHVDDSKVARIVARVNAERPDLVALLGDYVDPDLPLGGHVRPEAVAGELGGLVAPLGVFAVLGNHDVDYAVERVALALRAVGVRVLEDEAACVHRNGGELAVVGLSEPESAQPRGAVPELPAGGERDAILLLSHSPDAFPRVPPEVSLTLAGHTHGGQIDIPGMRVRAIPSRFGTRFKKGHIVENGRHLFVSEGIGTSRLPLRLGAPPEVPVLELHGERGRAPAEG